MVVVATRLGCAAALHPYLNFFVAWHYRAAGEHLSAAATSDTRL